MSSHLENAGRARIFLFAIALAYTSAVFSADCSPLFETVIRSQTKAEHTAPMFKSRRSVRVHRELLAEEVSPASLQFELIPGKIDEGVVDRIYKTSNDDRVFVGKLRGLPDSTFMLLCHGDAVVGDFTVSTLERYQLRGSADTAAIRRLDPTVKMHCGTAPGSTPLRDDGAAANARAEQAAPHRQQADDPAQFDVMIVYTPAARDSEGGVSGIEATAALAVESANAAYANSGIHTRARLVRTQEVEYAESGSANTDLERLASADDGAMDEVHAWRDACHADLVSLFVENFSSTTDIAGVAKIAVLFHGGKPLGQEFNGFTTVIAAYASPFTFAHEVGHNFGCLHAMGDPQQGLSSNFPYGYGWRFAGNDGTQYRTVMAYAPGSQIPYFASPSILYKGVPTGVANAADDARLMNENAALVADFRSKRTLSVTATVPTATENPATNGRFTFVRSGPTDVPITISYRFGGTATIGVDYQVPSESITIPVGASTATLDIVPIDDDLAEGAESVTVDLEGGDHYVLGAATHAEVILRDSTVEVSVSASGSSGFVIQRTGSLDQPLTVGCKLRGNALTSGAYAAGDVFVPTDQKPYYYGNGNFYLVYLGAIIIPAGSPQIILPVNLIASSTSASASAVCEILASDTYQTAAPSAAEINLAGDPNALARVSVTATASGAFSFSYASLINSQPVEIDFNLTGSALLNQDYVIISDDKSDFYSKPTLNGEGLPVHRLIIPSGSTSGGFEVSLNVTHITPSPSGGSEVSLNGLQAIPKELRVSLVPSYAVDRYVIDPAAASASTTFSGVYGTPQVDFTVKVKKAREAGLRKATVIATRTGDLATDLIIAYTVSGSARAGINYVPLPGQLIIPAGMNSAKIDIMPIEDHIHTGKLKLTLSLQADNAYSIGNHPTGEVVIKDAN